ncbi:DUF4234 domain-containing protein [Actinomadura logoneensis]|uniref:DUF4234 domain-containing protein n=1 Tax=Actinomadura logoneensis TaxID=2293572 RepID=UPI0018F21B9D|nr:DUF4234 domain-containing protein [Actinomadura logoneensis]
MKQRNIFAVWLGLPIITLGIYGFVWIYKIHDELNRTFPQNGASSGGSALLSVLFGWLTLGIWPLIVLIKFGTGLAEAQRRAGRQPSFSNGLGILLVIFGFGPLYYQNELNKIAQR